jgi:hypothetical protein
MKLDFHRFHPIGKIFRWNWKCSWCLPSALEKPSSPHSRTPCVGYGNQLTSRRKRASEQLVRGPAVHGFLSRQAAQNLRLFRHRPCGLSPRGSRPGSTMRNVTITLYMRDNRISSPTDSPPRPPFSVWGAAAWPTRPNPTAGHPREASRETQQAGHWFGMEEARYVHQHGT